MHNIRGRSPLLWGLQLSKAEILRSSLIWGLVPMIQISSKSEVFDRYLNFQGASAPWLWPDPEITPGRFIPWPRWLFWHINRSDPPSRWLVKAGQTNQRTNQPTGTLNFNIDNNNNNTSYNRRPSHLYAGIRSWKCRVNRESRKRKQYSHTTSTLLECTRESYITEFCVVNWTIFLIFIIFFRCVQPKTRKSNMHIKRRPP